MVYPSQPSEFDEESLKAVTTSRDLRTVHPELVKRFSRLSTAYTERNPGRTLLITCAYRSCFEQQRLYQIGRNGNPGQIVTCLDGVTHKSRHNSFPATAIDVCVLIGGKGTYDEVYYYPLVALCNEFGLESGMGWVKFVDPPHIQLKLEDIK